MKKDGKGSTHAIGCFPQHRRRTGHVLRNTYIHIAGSIGVPKGFLRQCIDYRGAGKIEEAELLDFAGLLGLQIKVSDEIAGLLAVSGLVASCLGKSS